MWTQIIPLISNYDGVIIDDGSFITGCRLPGRQRGRELWCPQLRRSLHTPGRTNRESRQGGRALAAQRSMQKFSKNACRKQCIQDRSCTLARKQRDRRSRWISKFMTTNSPRLWIICSQARMKSLSGWSALSKMNQTQSPDNLWCTTWRAQLCVHSWSTLCQ